MSAVESDAIHVRRMAISDVDGVFALIYNGSSSRNQVQIASDFCKNVATNTIDFISNKMLPF